MTAATVPANAMAALRGAKLAVVQPLPGIGDMIWHLPHLRALAAAAGRPVTLVTKRGSRADEILASEPSVGGIVWLSGNTTGRGGLRRRLFDVSRLTGELRAGRFDAAVLLHQSVTLAAIAALAGIPRRFGYGYGRQRLLLNRGPFLPAAMWPLHPYRQASAWLQAAGLAQADAEPVLTVTQQTAALVRARLQGGGIAPVIIGIGSSEANKQWGAERFAALVRLLRAAGWPQVILAGGPSEAALAAEIVAQSGEPPLLTAMSWPLGELAALLAQSAFYVGNDTGAANIAAAVGVTTYCLFGATAPLEHSRRIVAIVPPGGIDRAGGMARITPEAVMARIAALTPPA